MGLSRAKRFLLMAETLDAQQALACGLIDFVASGDRLMTEAEATARKFTKGATPKRAISALELDGVPPAVVETPS